MDCHWTHSPVDWDWTVPFGWESSWNPVDWTILQSNLAGRVHWSPLESNWITWGMVKTSTGLLKGLEKTPDVTSRTDDVAVRLRKC